MSFHSRLTSSTDNSEGHWPNDLAVFGAGFEEIVRSMSPDVRPIPGLIFLDSKEEEVWFRVQNDVAKLRKEVREGLCLLFMSAGGEVVRVVDAVALRITSSTGHILAQMGVMED